MKSVLIIAALTTISSYASASIFGCGYGHTYRYLQCSVSSTATYEAGYTEEYASTLVNVDSAHAMVLPEKFEVAGLKGEMKFELQNGQQILKVSVDQPLKDADQVTTAPVEFPDSCDAEVPSFQLSSRYDQVTSANTASERELSINCTAITRFQKD